MRSVRPRVLLQSLLVGSLVALQTGIGVAQIPGIPDPTGGGTQDTLDQTVNDTATTVDNTTGAVTDPVKDTVNQTTDTATDTVNNTTNTATETTNNATNTVNNTVNQTTDTVPDTTNNVTNTVNNTVTETTNNTTNTVNNTVNQTNNTVNDTTNTVEEVVQSPKPKPAPKTSPVTTVTDTVGTVVGTTGTVNTGTQDAISALGGATGQYAGPSPSTEGVIAPSAGPADAISAIAAATGGTGTAGLLGASGGLAESSETGSAALYYSSTAAGIVPGGLAKRFLGSRFLLNWTAILGVAQPNLAILVDAVNDADGDGVYSDAEIAATPGADVSFKALVTNIGAVSFEIATVTHSFNGGTGPAQGTVCGELAGIMLAPGESLACSFPVPDYAPAKGGSLVSTITAAGFEVGKGARRGASDSDTSTVDTLLAGDEVLAGAIERNLAFTGTDAARLLALGLLLLAAGGTFLSLARHRSRRPPRPLPTESFVDTLGWWAAGPDRTGLRRRVGRR
ncbi:MAG TPA: hypothetical protein VE915_06855 [Actinomycetota bacterium]|nr:hypothetical protein [Actinomycetota bacterium]